jgi:formyl-CoA transferase
VPEQVGNDHPTSMPTSAYTTADGYMNVAAAGKVMWQRLCEAIGRNDLVDHPDYRDAAGRSTNRAGLNAQMNQALAARTTAEWVEILNQAGVPCGAINTMDKVFADPQVQHLQAATEVTHPKLGKMKLINQAVKLSRTPARLATATPERGEHTEELLGELGYDAAAIQRLRNAGVI